MTFQSSRTHKECYIYKTSDNWDDLPSMSEKRLSYGVVQLSPTSFWITGQLPVVIGSNLSKYLNFALRLCF